MNQPDADAAPVPTASDASAEPEAPGAPAMQADSGLVVDVVKGSGGPPEHKAVVIDQNERR